MASIVASAVAFASAGRRAAGSTERAVGTGDGLRHGSRSGVPVSADRPSLGAQEAARRRADRAPDHRGEGARAGVAELGGDARHRQLARGQRHGARQQHLLAPLHERRAELAAEQARQGARAGAGVGGPGGERGVARRRRRSPLRRGGAGAFPAAGRRRGGPARRGAARRARARRGGARARASRAVERRRRGRRAACRAASASASSRLETSSTRHWRQPADSAAERAGPQRAARLVQVEREQLGVLDHRDRVLDAGRDPDRARRRHDVAAVRRGDADHAGRRQRDLPPGWRVRNDARVGAQAQQLGAHRPRGASACRGAASAGRSAARAAGRGFIGAISIEVDALSLTRRAAESTIGLAPPAPRSRPPMTTSAASLPSPSARQDADRDGPGRPGALRQPLQPAAAAAALPVAEGRVPRQLRRARRPADGLLRRLVRGAGASRASSSTASGRGRSCSAASRCSPSRPSASPRARATRCWSLFAVVAGIGNGVFHPVDYTLLNRKVHPSRLGHAFSVHGITGSLGWALAPAMLVPIALAFSWRVALACAGVLVLVVLGGAGAEPLAPARSRRRAPPRARRHGERAPPRPAAASPSCASRRSGCASASSSSTPSSSAACRRSRPRRRACCTTCRCAGRRCA